MGERERDREKKKKLNKYTITVTEVGMYIISVQILLTKRTFFL